MSFMAINCLYKRLLHTIFLNYSKNNYTYNIIIVIKTCKWQKKTWSKKAFYSITFIIVMNIIITHEMYDVGNMYV